MRPPTSATRSATCASLFKFRRVTVVWSCVSSPISRAWRSANMARSKVPATPRKLSCVAASGPSRLIAIRAMPDFLNRSMAFAVSSGVALGVTLVRSPSSTLWRIRSNKSGRLSGSPPVNTISGSPNERIWSSKRYPCSLVSSPGLRPGMADARQCTHARSQACVTSQITNNGD